MENNLKQIKEMNKIAQRKNCSPGQLSLAWLLHQGPDVIPIPGTTKIPHLDENMASRNIELSAEDIQELNALFDPKLSYGDRYADMSRTYHGNK